jgi:hypothetical protein
VFSGRCLTGPKGATGLKGLISIADHSHQFSVNQLPGSLKFSGHQEIQMEEILEADCRGAADLEDR